MKSIPKTQWWWLSFCDPDGIPGQSFLGVAIVRASSIEDAAETAWSLGINPGGEVLGGAVNMPKSKMAFVNRLLTADEAKAVQS